MNVNSNWNRRLIFLLTLTGLGILLLLFRLLYWQGLPGHHYVVTIAERPVNLTYAFLVWNLWLAWIPFLLTGWLSRAQLPALAFYGMALVWLLFLPNSPYIVTDLIHLRDRPPVPLWYDGVLILVFAVTGLLLGFFSVGRMEALLARRWGARPAQWVSVGVFFLCGVGIYLGRILRWNTWDIVVHPRAIAADLLHMAAYPSLHREAWGMSLVFFALLLVMYCGGKRITSLSTTKTST